MVKLSRFLLLSFVGVCFLTQVSAWQGANVTVCQNGCSTASLQEAMDVLARCGDTIRIREAQRGNFRFMDRGCESNPITVTSDRMDWLPAEGTRVTPSHLANLAQLSTPNSEPVLMGVLSPLGKAPTGWTFVGLAFTTNSQNVTYALVDIAGLGYQPQSDADTPNGITFDRCYFFGPLPGPGYVPIQNVLRANGRNVTIKNSFIGDAAWPGVETHGIFMLEAPGPVTIENNFILASSIPIFAGGAPPSYPVVPSHVQVRYNYTFRPWKWNSDPKQPYASDYTANGATYERLPAAPIAQISNSGLLAMQADMGINDRSVLTIDGVQGCAEANGTGWRVASVTDGKIQLDKFPGCSSPYTGGGTATDRSYQVCTKNHGEMKFADGVLWQYNVGENSWGQTECGSQRTGFTNTTRTSWELMTTLVLNSPTQLSWSDGYEIGGRSSCCSNQTKDLGLCISMSDSGTECRPVASFDNVTKSLQVTQGFSSSQRGPVPKAWLSYTGSARLANLTLTNNVWRNVSQGISVLGYSFSNGVGDAGYGKNHNIVNNLWWNTNTYVQSWLFWGAMAGEADYVYAPTDYTFSHNTYYSSSPLSLAFAFFSAQECVGCATKKQPKFERLTWSNNLMGSKAQVAFGGDSFVGLKDAAADAYLSNSRVQNNAIPGVVNPNGCSNGNVCSGNLSNDWSDPFVDSLFGTLKVAPGNRYAGAATDAKDIGADFDQLPIIHDLKVTTLSHSATLDFDLNAPIGDAGGTQPCVLEVSSNRNLVSYLGPYKVIRDLDPTLFRRADSTTRESKSLPPVMVSNRHVTWPLGTEMAGTVVPDNGGDPVSLGLDRSTTYYGRLMCYGDTQTFTFHTEGMDRRRSLQFKVAAMPEVTTVRAFSGKSANSQDAMEDFKVGPGGETVISIPLGELPTYYRLEFRNGSKTVQKSKVYRSTDPDASRKLASFVLPKPRFEYK